jgi:hypothetical protein
VGERRGLATLDQGAGSCLPQLSCAAALHTTPLAAITQPEVQAWVAWGICALYWVAISTGYALRLSYDVGFHVLDELGWRIGYGSCATVGAIIASRRPRNVLGWILCAVGLTSGVAGFAQDYASYALVHRHDWLAGGLVLGWLGSWPWYIAFGLILTFLLLLFPDGRLPSRRWRPLAWAAAVDLTVLTVWAAFAPRPLEGPPGMPANPWAIEWAAGLFRVLDDIAGLTLVALAALSAASLVLRFRRSRGTQRQQLKWFTYAALVTVGSWILLGATRLDERLSGPVWLLTMLSPWLIPAAIGIAILRYRLYDIDRLINRTLVFGLLSALLAAVYAGAVLVLGQLFGGLGGEPPSWVVAGATLAVAALFQPARLRIQQVVDRRFNRRKVRRRQDHRGVQHPAAGAARPRHALGRAASRRRPDHAADAGITVASTATHNSVDSVSR